MTKAETAKSLFLEGYNCAQAIAGAFHKELKLEFNAAVRLASGFGGGMGRQREVCGAVSGIVMVLSVVFGYEDKRDSKGKAELYARVQELCKGFSDRNGSIVCRELLKGKADNSSTPDERTSAYYENRPCTDLISDAAAALEGYMNSLGVEL